MKGRDGRGAPSADLLVCFPSRAHLSLIPKPICSPARPNEPNKRLLNNHHHLRKSINRGGGGGGSQASPWLSSKNKHMGSEISEPTSPKVTCAGQIKVRHKPNSIKNWQSVMEEIEKLHTNRKQKKRPAWGEALGIKKDVMQFLTCLRSIRFDFRCFGSFPTADVTSDDEEDDEEDQDNHQEDYGDEESKAVFSKWFMVLQENQNNGISNEEKYNNSSFNEESDSNSGPCVPPSNALLLMRCRSAPAKSWLEERREEEEEEEDDDEEEGNEDAERKLEEDIKAKLEMEMEKERKKKRDNLVVMRYETDFHKLSSDIAKETWVVGGSRDPLPRSRSWKR